MDKTLFPLSYLQDDYNKKICLILLNQPLDQTWKMIEKLWNRSLFKAVTDGGINQLFEAVGNDLDSYLPDLISGDFDSASPKILDIYREKGVEVVQTPDQNATDFTKCLHIVLDKIDENKVDCIVVIGGIGGRFDHTMANLNTLYRAVDLTSLPIYMQDHHSLACVLNQGSHRIMNNSLCGKWCGLLPVGCDSATVSTTGLKWNLDNYQLKFSGLVSTSNKHDENSDHVTVVTDKRIVWTMAIKYSS
ncbi:thiamine pyrophosphokinase 1-like [Tubulanus polymorphus]|uniref:thiamine pyrophosphokinase 1-like n=1 Tax=Tubulanus polymorphus TaxID=672921 RepID=UPI003DA303A6